MAVGLLGVVVQLGGGFFGHRVRQHPQGPAGLQGADIGFCRALEIIEPVERIGHGTAQHQHAVIAHDHHTFLRVAQLGCTARALILEGQPAIALVNHGAVEEGAAILVDRRQGAVGKAGQHGGKDRMHMHHATRMWHQPMHPAMQPPGRGVGGIGARHNCRIIGVEQQHVGCADAGKMHLVGVHQELCAFRVHGQREMVGHRLVHVQPRGPAKGGGKLNAFVPMGNVRGGVRRRRGHGGSCVDAHRSLARFGAGATGWR